MGPSAEKLNPAQHAKEAAHISAINMGFASVTPSLQSELLMKEKESSRRELSFPELAVNGKLQNHLKVTHENYSDVDEDDEESGFYLPYPEDSAGGGYGVDQRDEGTSDSWIKRHPDLVRLTGRHPFNCEAPLSRLIQHGFLTPTSLHYVRNHGYVPKAMPDALDNWTVEISGMVRTSRTLTVAQIMHEFKPREIPVTLVCAGNRRKEENMVQQTIGFNWGAAGVSTSLWKGARLVDILKSCGVYSKKKGAHFVCFEGEETLPGGGGSRYGTSISVDVALDEACDVLVAYMQNGKILEPDHGFPIRIIIPGYIGGRMVKWLRRITVTSEESDNYYHYNDNRVLPSHVDADKANSEGWWFKPEYIINELNINSAICTPAHGEVLPINVQTLQVPYTVQGYAYSGGGRKVIRVEVSIDGGESWLLSRIYHPEKPTKYGKYWCWCFWELDINVMQLLQAKELVVRAWDASMNTQPQKLTWNVMGMMNNCWFTVRINPCKPKGDGIGLAFEHPTQPGNLSGGWMAPRSAASTEQQEKTPTLAKSFSSPMLNRSIRQITNAELKRHNTRESPWIVVHNVVYDCTKFLKDHPGGSDSILINSGMDCTEEFDAIHSAKAKAMLEDFKIGELASFGTISSADSTPDNSMHGGNRAFTALDSLFPISEVAPTVRHVALNPKKKIPCKLISKQTLSHDVRLFRFELPSKDHILGLPVGKHIFVSATIGGKLCMRAYTPTSSDEEVGYFELLIKVYFKDVHPKFPLGGLMSQHLDSLEIGGSVDVKGPLGHIEYTGNGNYTAEGKPGFMSKCAMLAGGTGITPMYQLLRAILKNPEDKTEIYLVFANRTEEDIMLRTELDKWASEHSNFKVWYVIERPINPETWVYSTGFINEEIVRQHLPCRSVDTSAFMCGPPPMIQFACRPNLEKLGYDKSRCFEF
ncbi:hypothetical protein GOP47_0000468 [Adiantum capillus-veneris]|uniref:Nitrate reductase n=1 Tax=Adiantum capillus-veneris TaxID=13818 RepID=A0A9D4VDD0_ADICA|nr:hypothetical protein GOP47_0000468 [Adiantum capillus-veneris]